MTSGEQLRLMAKAAPRRRDLGAAAMPVGSRRQDGLLLVPTGSTLFNLACSGKPDGAFIPGSMVSIVGDSASGKTVLSLSCFAEMARLPAFDDYRFIYRDAEAALQIDLKQMFGTKAAARIERDDREIDTVEDFEDDVLKKIADGRPFIYVLDSFDAISDEAEQKFIRTRERAKAKAEAAGKEAKGSYGTMKAKGASKLFRNVVRALKKTKSLLIVISQTRANLDPMSFEKKTYSGGRAIKFYATHQAWLAVNANIVRELDKIKRVVGTRCAFKVSKNKLTGRLRSGTSTVYYDYGLDDIGSIVDWLVATGGFETVKNSVLATGLFDKPLSREKLIATIEQQSRERELQAVAGRWWDKIEERFALNRKPRYD